MPRKKMHRLSGKEADDVLGQLLANTAMGRHNRELAIARVCKKLGFDPDDEHERHAVFGYLAYFAPPYLVPGLYPRGKKQKKVYVTPKDMLVIQAVAGSYIKLVNPKPEQLDQQNAILSKIFDLAIDAAERNGILTLAARRTNKRRIMRKFVLLIEQIRQGQK